MSVQFLPGQAGRAGGQPSVGLRVTSLKMPKNFIETSMRIVSTASPSRCPATCSSRTGKITWIQPKQLQVLN